MSELSDNLANWIVKNEHKKGTDDFNTVATAFTQSLKPLSGDSLNEKPTNNLLNFDLSMQGSASNKKISNQQENQNVTDVKEAKVIKLPSFISNANAGDSIINSVLMPKLIQAESNGQHINPETMQLTESSAGAKGITQIMPATGIDPGYGVAPLKNTSEIEYKRFTKDYMIAMLKEFDGNTEKALAAYNWGPVNLKSHIKKYGDSWKKSLPDETKKYITTIMSEK